MSDEVIVLADRGDEQKVIEEEKQEWLLRVLLALGVKEEALELQGMDLIDYLSMAAIEVWSNYDGSIDVLRKDKVVAQWRVPELILIKGTPKKWYYEIHINEWALPFQMQRRRK